MTTYQHQNCQFQIQLFSYIFQRLKFYQIFKTDFFLRPTIYQKFKTIKIVVKSRDFVFATRVFREENRWVVIAKSIDYPELPPIKESVRGDLKIAGWILQKIEQGTKTCFITMVDPKGSIPAAIVASSAKEQGQCVEKVKALLDKRNKK